MQNIDIARGLIFKELGVSKDSFDERLISQKKVYLLKTLGIDLGFSFNWYIHGPYSPRLTTYFYDNLGILIEFDYSKYQLDEAVRQKTKIVNEILDQKPPHMNNSSWYELIASLLYLCKQNSNSKDLFNILKVYKPQFDEEDYEKAKMTIESISDYKKLLPA